MILAQLFPNVFKPSECFQCLTTTCTYILPTIIYDFDEILKWRTNHLLCLLSRRKLMSNIVNKK